MWFKNITLLTGARQIGGRWHCERAREKVA